LKLFETLSVDWKEAADSLETSCNNLNKSSFARRFVESYVDKIVANLLVQDPNNLIQYEQQCVEDSLLSSCKLVAKDLAIQINRGCQSKCQLLDKVLGLVFDPCMPYYHKDNEYFRRQNIEMFRLKDGFELLAQYLVEKVMYQKHYCTSVCHDVAVASSPSLLVPPVDIFPTLDTLHHILTALFEVISDIQYSKEDSKHLFVRDAIRNNTIYDSITIASAVMYFLQNVTEAEIMTLATDHVATVLEDLRSIFDYLSSTHVGDTNRFYAFWRAIILKLIRSSLVNLNALGWSQLDKLIDACAKHEPPPQFYLVEGAQCKCVNGIYHFAGKRDVDGNVMLDEEIVYDRVVSPYDESLLLPRTIKESASHEPFDVNFIDSLGEDRKISLICCKLLSKQKKWFISELDKEHPGTDRDLDYYVSKSYYNENRTLPPLTDWQPCGVAMDAEVDTPPTLTASKGLVLALGNENNTLEHQLVKWAIENDVCNLCEGGNQYSQLCNKKLKTHHSTNALEEKP
jgi:hypothetical protein